MLWATKLQTVFVQSMTFVSLLNITIKTGVQCFAGSPPGVCVSVGPVPLQVCESVGPVPLQVSVVRRIEPLHLVQCMGRCEYTCWVCLVKGDVLNSKVTSLIS